MKTVSYSYLPSAVLLINIIFILIVVPTQYTVGEGTFGKVGAVGAESPVIHKSTSGLESPDSIADRKLRQAPDQYYSAGDFSRNQQQARVPQFQQQMQTFQYQQTQQILPRRLIPRISEYQQQQQQPFFGYQQKVLQNQQQPLSGYQQQHVLPKQQQQSLLGYQQRLPLSGYQQQQVLPHQQQKPLSRYQQQQPLLPNQQQHPQLFQNQQSQVPQNRPPPEMFHNKNQQPQGPQIFRTAQLEQPRFPTNPQLANPRAQFNNHPQSTQFWNNIDRNAPQRTLNNGPQAISSQDYRPHGPIYSNNGVHPVPQWNGGSQNGQQLNGGYQNGRQGNSGSQNAPQSNGGSQIAPISNGGYQIGRQLNSGSRNAQEMNGGSQIGRQGNVGSQYAPQSDGGSLNAPILNAGSQNGGRWNVGSQSGRQLNGGSQNAPPGFSQPINTQRSNYGPQNLQQSQQHVVPVMNIGGQNIRQWSSGGVQNLPQQSYFSTSNIQQFRNSPGNIYGTIQWSTGEHKTNAPPVQSFQQSPNGNFQHKQNMGSQVINRGRQDFQPRRFNPSYPATLYNPYDLLPLGTAPINSLLKSSNSTTTSTGGPSGEKLNTISTKGLGAPIFPQNQQLRSIDGTTNINKNEQTIPNTNGAASNNNQQFKAISNGNNQKLAPTSNIINQPVAPISNSNNQTLEPASNGNNQTLEPASTGNNQPVAPISNGTTTINNQQSTPIIKAASSANNQQVTPISSGATNNSNNQQSMPLNDGKPVNKGQQYQPVNTDPSDKSLTPNSSSGETQVGPISQSGVPQTQTNATKLPPQGGPKTEVDAVSPQPSGPQSFYTQDEVDAHYRRMLAHNETKKDSEFENDTKQRQWYMKQAQQLLRAHKKDSDYPDGYPYIPDS